MTKQELLKYLEEWVAHHGRAMLTTVPDSAQCRYEADKMEAFATVYDMIERLPDELPEQTN